MAFNDRTEIARRENYAKALFKWFKSQLSDNLKAKLSPAEWRELTIEAARFSSNPRLNAMIADAARAEDPDYTNFLDALDKL